MMSDIVLGTCEITAWRGRDELVVTLPKKWQAYLRTEQGREEMVLRAGNRRVTVRVSYQSRQDVQMTVAVRRALLLPLGTVSVRAVEGELHFGPFVGVYALPSDEPGNLFGEMTSLLQDMTKIAALEGVALYVFLPGEIDWKAGVARCYAYKEGKRSWVRTKRPLPDLILPKIMGKPLRWRERIRFDLGQIGQRVPFGTFSMATGHKWEVHRTLMQQDATRRFLPETRLVRSSEDVEELLARHRIVYVKPCYGTQGYSIYRLSLQAQHVRIQYTKHKRTLTHQLKRSGEKWRSFLRKRFCGRRSFLVQQGIELLTDRGGGPVDFRWLIQKDGQNRWEITARVARVGNFDAITTNLHTGGRAVHATDLLRQNGFDEEKSLRQVLGKLDEASHLIARQIEEKAGRIGELGIDFGVTKRGDVYMIEINPRPGRQMLKQTSSEVRALSLQRNLEYAKYTTGFAPPT